VSGRNTETAYVWEPDLPGPGGKAVSKDFKWCRLVFPIKDHWYSAMELNSPTNPVEELSWRDYGRFGFFFKKTLRRTRCRNSTIASSCSAFPPGQTRPAFGDGKVPWTRRG
jgi:hypothetical protein